MIDLSVKDKSDLGLAASRASLQVPANVIIMVPGGSHAYGLATPESDEDYRGVFVAPTDAFWRLSQPSETIERKTPDIVVHELGKFCALAIKGNPSVLETLWTEPGYFTGLGLELQGIRKAFLWKGSLQPYIGYAKSQLWRLGHNQRPQNQGREGADPKFSLHLHRILLAGIHLAMTGEVLVDVSKPADPTFGDHRDALMDVRAGSKAGWSLANVVARANIYLSSLQKWADQTSLPERPDVERVEAFLRKARFSCLTN